jgi:bifunctional UDP-N-acetylglucosamine pyrophosphorylase/glucosamine-1-phosphate N-acetyltransferase
LQKGTKTASIIFAAGKGSRMKGYEGNKTLLPLVAGPSPFEGRYPILLHIIESLPPGPKALVINHRKEEIIELTSSIDVAYCEQPVLNGTGGALLASRGFMEECGCDRLLITMGDVPLVKPSTFERLLNVLEECEMAVLGFRPDDKRKYGILEIDNGRVKRIIEWKYWSLYSEEDQKRFEICNTGIYAARKNELIRFLDILETRPHKVLKERDGRTIEVEEFFITDLVEIMNNEGLTTGYAVAEDEDEVMGVDDVESLIKAQKKFQKKDKTGCT